MLRFHVSDQCRQLGLRAGAIAFRELQVADASPALRAEIDDAIQHVRREFQSASAIRTTRQVHAFREILRSVGVNPRKHPPTVERLLQMAIKRGALPAINNLVDAYNLVSLRSRFSLGAHDADRIAPPVELRMLAGDEPFIPLGKSSFQPVTAGEFGYVDAQRRVICWLDILQSDFSKVTHATHNVLLIIEGVLAHTADEFLQAVDDVRRAVHAECGGVSEVIAVLD